MPIIDLNFPVTNITTGGGTGEDTALTIRAFFDGTRILGDLVYISGPKIGSLYQVALIDRTSLIKMPVLGILIEKDTLTTGTIQLHGIITGIYTGLTPNATLFAGADGRITETIPVDPLSGIVLLQNIGQVIDVDAFELKPNIPIVLTSY